MKKKEIPTEFYYCKSFYKFPENTTIFQHGKKVSIEVGGKMVSNISQYLIDEKGIGKTKDYRIGLPVTGEGSQILNHYGGIAAFIKKNPTLDYLRFEHVVKNGLALCTFFEFSDIEKVEGVIDIVSNNLPYLIKVFRQPVTHLKEMERIVPVDLAKRVTAKTVRHLMSHPENWESVEGSKIIPQKVLTKNYEDDYTIYENVVFRNLIDKILFFLRRQIYYLSRATSTVNDFVHVDVFSRINHESYYLAVGKLYSAFFKNEDIEEATLLLEKAKKLHKIISKYLNSLVYTENFNAPKLEGELKKTNILTMHTDYKHIYNLYQKLSDGILENFEANVEMQKNGQKTYEQFCQLLTLFAASHFNFQFSQKMTILKDGEMNAKLTFAKWTCLITTEHIPILNINAINLTVTNNEKQTKYLLIPMSYFVSTDKKNFYEHLIKRLFKGGHKYDKYVFLSPFDYNGKSFNNYNLKHSLDKLHYAVLPVSIIEVDSFRRLQKLIFECMIKNDELLNTCAFCSAKLVEGENGEKRCKKCKLVINKIKCTKCSQTFKTTFADVQKMLNSDKLSEFDQHKKTDNFHLSEKKYLFRNITNMDEENFYCSNCNFAMPRI
ncbi:MAG: hypothetical protein FWE22_02940 [Firmicutes bacterium]|nr:hypothetical protein [Bacillota bacterium]